MRIPWTGAALVGVLCIGGSSASAEEAPKPQAEAAKPQAEPPKAQTEALHGLLAEVGYADALLAYELPGGKLMLIDGHLRAETTPHMMVPVLVPGWICTGMTAEVVPVIGADVCGGSVPASAG